MRIPIAISLATALLVTNVTAQGVPPPLDEGKRKGANGPVHELGLILRNPAYDRNRCTTALNTLESYRGERQQKVMALARISVEQQQRVQRDSGEVTAASQQADAMQRQMVGNAMAAQQALMAESSAIMQKCQSGELTQDQCMAQMQALQKRATQTSNQIQGKAGDLKAANEKVIAAGDKLQATDAEKAKAGAGIDAVREVDSRWAAKVDAALAEYNKHCLGHCELDAPAKCSASKGPETNRLKGYWEWTEERAGKRVPLNAAAQKVVDVIAKGSPQQYENDFKGIPKTKQRSGCHNPLSELNAYTGESQQMKPGCNATLANSKEEITVTVQCKEQLGTAAGAVEQARDDSYRYTGSSFDMSEKLVQTQAPAHDGSQFQTIMTARYVGKRIPSRDAECSN